MTTTHNNQKGFTLIELLVVIAIIGILSSVVLASLNSARAKARDAAVRQGVREFEKLLQLEYSDTGSYAALQSCTWLPISAPNCDSMFSGTYRDQARNICNNIVANATPVWGSPGYSLLICNGVDNGQKYSIMATLGANNYNNNYFFCSGSSGTTDNTTYWLSKIDGSDIQGNSARWANLQLAVI